MKGIIVNNGLKNMPMNVLAEASAKIEVFKHRIDELESLLKADRVLSNIQDPMELYSAMADLIREKLKILTLAIFVYHDHNKKFELVFSHGLDDLVFEFKNNEGLLWQKVLHKEPFHFNDISGDPVFSEFSKNNFLKKLHPELWVPFTLRGKVVGLLAMGEKGDGQPFNESDYNYIKHIATHASICLNNCILHMKHQKEKEELDKTLQNLSLLYNTGRAMTYISDLKNLLKYILEQAIERTQAEKGSIMLYDPATDQLSISVIQGLEDESYQEKINNKQIRCKSFKPGEGVAGKVFQTAKPIILNNTRGDDNFIEFDSSFVRSIACIPIVVYNDVIGVINVTNKRDEIHFTKMDLEMLKAVTDQAAVAINKAQLQEMAVTDFLTGLYIRRYFMVKLQDELHRAERYNKVFSVIMADIDKFKNINDTYGHTEGDRVLKEAGRFLQRNIRQIDVIARYGGEEFVILFPETDKKVAYALAERLRKGFSQIKLNNLPKISISLGIASYPEDGKAIEDLIKNADKAMYSAKQRGRNKVIKYSSHLVTKKEAEKQMQTF